MQSLHSWFVPGCLDWLHNPNHQHLRLSCIAYLFIFSFVKIVSEPPCFSVSLNSMGICTMLAQYLMEDNNDHTMQYNVMIIITIAIKWWGNNSAYKTRKQVAGHSINTLFLCLQDLRAGRRSEYTLFLCLQDRSPVRLHLISLPTRSESRSPVRLHLISLPESRSPVRVHLISLPTRPESRLPVRVHLHSPKISRPAHLWRLRLSHERPFYVSLHFQVRLSNVGFL